MRSKHLLPALLVLAALYGLGYGLARWRKCIVMCEYYRKEEYVIVRRTWPGFDMRDDWVGRTKNRLNPLLFTVFRPLALIEDRVRGGERPIQRPDPASL